MAGMGRALLAGVEGFNAGVDRAHAMQDREREIARQAESDQWAREDRALATEERGARMEDIRLNRLQKKLMQQLTAAYASRDPAQLDALYEAIPDGQSLLRPSEMTPDGKVRIHHPMGELQGSWDEAFFGNPGGPDGSGFSPGLYHFINPEALLQQRSAAQAAGVSAAAQAAKHQQAIDLANLKGDRADGTARIRAGASIEAARIRADAAAAAAGGAGGKAPTTKTLVDGSMVQWDGTGWVPATMQGPDGAGVPMRAPVQGAADPMKAIDKDIATATRNMFSTDMNPDAIAAGVASIDAARNAVAKQRGIGVPGSAPAQPVAVQPGDGKTAPAADGSGFVVGKVYEDDQGNRAVYRGNGQWEEQ